MQIVSQASMLYEGGTQVSFISELDDIDSLVRLYRPRILRYVAFSIGDLDLAETITQDCFLKAYNARASFRGDSAVGTWLFSIANNLIRDQLRAKKFQFWRKASATSLDVTEMASFLPSGSSSAEDRMLAQEKAKQVAAAVEKLSENQRRVFVLRFLEEFDVAEIVEMTGMPMNTVKTHLRRAVISVRAKVGGQG